MPAAHLSSLHRGDYSVINDSGGNMPTFDAIATQTVV
jgi:hypothetical protein